MAYTVEDGRVAYFRLMDRLQPYWRRLAIALKFPPYAITAMEQKDDPLYHLLSEWLHGANQERDSRPVTWATLVTALRDANVQEEADILEKHFVQIKLPKVPVEMSKAEGELIRKRGKRGSLRAGEKRDRGMEEGRKKACHEYTH